MIDFSETTKIAKTMEQLEQWEAAAAAWNQAMKKSGEDYSFQVNACNLLAQTARMEREIPKRRPDVLIRFGSKNITTESKRYENNGN